MTRQTVAAVVALAAVEAAAHGQWTATVLHPEGSTQSEALAVFNGKQVGWARIEGAPHAALWTGTAASLLDLNPAGADESRANALNGSQQVGYARFPGGQRRAALWSGTGDSWVDLTPPHAVRGELFAVHGGVQAGEIRLTVVSSQAIPSRWTGTVESWESRLVPDTTVGSVLGARAGREVGWCSRRGWRHAILWNGTTSVALVPDQGIVDSRATATYGNQQVGYVNFTGAHTYACLWTGSIESRVLLHHAYPLTDTDSAATAVHDGYQVGYMASGNPSTTSRAVLWQGTADSMEELSDALPPEFTNSRALGVWNDGTTLYVVGWAGFSEFAGEDHHAVLWSRPIPCAAEVSGDGDVNSEDISEFLTTWIQSVSGIHQGGDFNNDDVVNSTDISRFLTAWLSDVTSGGC